ncbi:MAG: hypothetical protein H7X88_07280 [Gloeobacteraceae cyanobacterium ES-bin-316]|nr:hypothetical protein [Ferruginibacter sp.]
MATILYKWFFIFSACVFSLGSVRHPVYVSVTEMEFNSKEKTLEVSCKLFTDDFEKALRSAYKVPVDLINPKDRPAMDRLVNDYVQKHLKISTGGKALPLKYLGYELIEEGIYSYFESANVEKLTQVSIFNNLLYEFSREQMGLVHLTVNGSRKSTKLNNPTDKVSISF